jgi:hypothetical protein
MNLDYFETFSHEAKLTYVRTFQGIASNPVIHGRKVYYFPMSWIFCNFVRGSSGENIKRLNNKKKKTKIDEINKRTVITKEFIRAWFSIEYEVEIDNPLHHNIIIYSIVQRHDSKGTHRERGERSRRLLFSGIGCRPC